ncbi:MAG: hypothetical protein ACPGTS_02365, partial [Minisyncoccia bacterium]
MKLGLNMNEYAVYDIIFKSQTSTIHGKDGWSDKSYAFIARNLGLKKGTVFSIIDRGVEWGLIEVNQSDPRLKKATRKWEQLAELFDVDDPEKHIDIENLRNRSKNERSKNERQIVQKMNDSVQKMNAINKVSKFINETNYKKSEFEAFIKDPNPTQEEIDFWFYLDFEDAKEKS